LVSKVFYIFCSKLLTKERYVMYIEIRGHTVLAWWRKV
jgi:hypothetical protein